MEGTGAVESTEHTAENIFEQLTAQKEETVKLRQQVASLSANIDSSKETERELRSQLDSATKCIEQSKNDIDDLTFQIGSADVEIKMYKGELQSLRSKLSDEESVSKQLREELGGLRSEKETFQVQLQNERIRSDSIRMSLSASHADDDVDFGIGHDLIHDHDHQETETKVKNLEQLVEELHQSLTQAEEENNALRGFLESQPSGEKSQTFFEEMQVVRKELADLRKEKDEEITTLKKRISQLENEKSELQQQIRSLLSKQDLLSRNAPSSLVVSNGVDANGVGTKKASHKITISNQNSLQKALSDYVSNGITDDILQELNNLALKYEKVKLHNANLLSKVQSTRGNIQVCCRTRPPSHDELSTGGKVILDATDESELSCFDWKMDSWKPFAFDHVWPPEASQADVFADVEPMIASVADGFNVCIFAYGQTGSGKTYTMEGYGTDYGIYYRSIQKLFDLVHAKSYAMSSPASSKKAAPNMPSARRSSMGGNAGVGLNSPLEKLFGATNSGRDSGTGRSSDSRRSSFRSDDSSLGEDVSPVVATVGNGGKGGEKTLKKQPSMFEFSNPISSRKSILQISTPQADVKKEQQDDYGFVADRSEDKVQVKSKIEMSMLEIYNEQVYDLLNDRWQSSNGNSNLNGQQGALDLRQGADGTVIANGLTTTEVKNMSEAMAVFGKGASNRATAATFLNALSSRSHLVVQIDITIDSVDEEASAIHGRLYLVDLAGSEKVEKSGATGIAMKEAQHINKSLSALGDVMEALDKKQQHVPYRNSKLTYFLQNALGGNARCMMIANVCPTDLTYDETNFTLQFATRVRNVNLGPAARNSNMKNMEQALKLIRQENRDLKKKKQALEDALSLAKKEGTQRVNEKINDARMRQLEETKKAADAFIQQLTKQLHDANVKILEEKRLREQATYDAELMQRNLKRAMDQMKESSKNNDRQAHAAANRRDALEANASKIKSPYGGVHTQSGVTSPPGATAASSKNAPHHTTPVSRSFHSPTGNVKASAHHHAATSEAKPKTNPETTVRPAPLAVSDTVAAKDGDASNKKAVTATSPSIRTLGLEATLAHSVAKALESPKVSPERQIRDAIAAAHATAAAEAQILKKHNSELASASLPPSPSHSSPYKEKMKAVMQRQLSTEGIAAVSEKTSASIAESAANKVLTANARTAAANTSQHSIDDDEEIFEVDIPVPDGKETTTSPRRNGGMGERKVSLDMILDDLSVVSVDEISLADVSHSTTTTASTTHATSTLAKRIARTNPGLFSAGVVDAELAASINKDSASQRPAREAKTASGARASTNPTLTKPLAVKRAVPSSTHASLSTSPHRPSTSLSRSNTHTPTAPTGSSLSPSPNTRAVQVKSGASSTSATVSVTTASARAAMVTTSSPVYRKPVATSSHATPTADTSSVASARRTPGSAAGTVGLKTPPVSRATPGGSISGAQSRPSPQTRATPATVSASYAAAQQKLRSPAGIVSPLKSSTATPPNRPRTAGATASGPEVYHANVSIPVLTKTPPALSDRAKAALDTHKNRLHREPEKPRSLKILDKSSRF